MPKTSPISKQPSYAEKHYKGSPLQILVQKLLGKVVELKKTYALKKNKADNSPEQIEAMDYINTVEIVLKFMEEQCHKFDNGKSPGFDLSFIAAIKKVKAAVDSLKKPDSELLATIAIELPYIVTAAQNAANKPLNTAIVDQLLANKEALFKTVSQKKSLDDILNLFNTKILALDLTSFTSSTDVVDHIRQQLALYKLTPKHPMMYELLETMIEVTKEAPAELIDLIPFIDPAEIGRFLNEGTFGALAKTLNPRRLTHVKNELSDELSFVFNASTGDDSPVETLDVSKLYKENRLEGVERMLIPATRRFLATMNPENADATVQKGLARTASEMARVNLLQQFAEMEQKFVESCVSTATQAIETSATIAEVLKKGQERIAENHQLRATLALRATAYKSQTVEALLQGQHVSNLESEIDRTLDVRYLQDLLPEEIFCTTNGVDAFAGSAVPMRGRLAKVIEDSILSLDNSELEIQARMHKQALELSNRACANYQATLDTLLLPHQIDNAAAIDPLSDADLAAEAIKRQTVQDQIAALLTTIQASLPASPYDSAYKTLIATAKAAMGTLSAAQKQADQAQQKRQLQAEKMKSDALYQANLDSANPTLIKEMQENLQTQLSKIPAKQQGIQEHMEAMKATIATQTSALEDIHTQMSGVEKSVTEFQAQRDALEVRTRTLLETTPRDGTKSDLQLNDDGAFLKQLHGVKETLNEKLIEYNAKPKHTPKIPFESIEKILAKGHGFDKLLTALKDEFHTKIDWKDYRDRQENLFRTSATREQFLTAVNALLEAIDNKISRLETEIKTHYDIIRNQTALDALQPQLTDIESKLSDAQKELEALQLRSVEIKSTIEVQTNAFGVAEQELTVLGQESEEAKRSIEIFKTLNSLYEEINQLNVTLESAPEEALDQLQILDNKIEMGLSSVGKLKDHESYLAKFQSLRQLIAPIKKRIITKIAEKLPQQEAVSQDNLIVEDSQIVAEPSAEDSTVTEVIIEATPADDAPVLPETSQAQEQDSKIAQRSNLATQLIQRLNEYIQQREAHNKIKDTFSSKDKVARSTFVDELKEHLQNYNTTGNADDSLKCIRDNIQRFPKGNLEIHLNKIMVELLDFEETAYNANHEQAQELLATMEGTHPTYVQKMRDLYKKLNDMSTYGAALTKKNDPTGESVTKMAEKLRNDVNNFINTAGNKIPKIDHYNAFKERFTARLHSEKDIMDIKDNKWAQILGNIALLLFVIPQLIYSKVTTGRFRFFFDNTTKKTELVNSLHDSTSELDSELTPGPSHDSTSELDSEYAGPSTPAAT